MINNQHNNEKRFGPKRNVSFGHNQPNTNSRSFSAVTSNVNAKTKSFVAENLNKLRASNLPAQAGKNLVFIRKEQSRGHNNQNSGHRNTPKKHGVRKVTSEFATKKEQVIPLLAQGNIRIVPLGGVDAIGKNMTAVEYGDDIEDSCDW